MRMFLLVAVCSITISLSAQDSTLIEKMGLWELDDDYKYGDVFFGLMYEDVVLVGLDYEDEVTDNYDENPCEFFDYIDVVNENRFVLDAGGCKTDFIFLDDTTMLIVEKGDCKPCEISGTYYRVEKEALYNSWDDVEETLYNEIIKTDYKSDPLFKHADIRAVCNCMVEQLKTAGYSPNVLTDSENVPEEKLEQYMFKCINAGK